MNAKTKTKRKAKQIRRLNKKLLKSEDKYNIFNPSCEIDIEYILGIKEPPMVVNIPMTPNNIPKYKPRLKVPNHEDIIGIDFNCGSHFIVCSNNKIYKYSELEDFFNDILTVKVIALESLDVVCETDSENIARYRDRWNIVRDRLKLLNIKIISINKYYPSSQTCSNCNKIKLQKMKLSNRVFKCKYCKTEIDRDLNAAINIKKQAIKTLSFSKIKI